MRELLSYLQEHATEMLEDVERLVRLESPSLDRDAINRVQGVNENWFGEFGRVTRHAADAGDTVHVQIEGRSTGRMLLLAHVDTVYPAGAWGDVWRVADGRAYGPGVYDMKGGIVQARWALRSLRALGRVPEHAIDVLLTADEEVGSDAARPLIESLARGAAAV
ncbi:MAG TPA: M20/M25/M40 family metallo-hydrolase, partial [Anaerolineales bacterium]|nr:M20/M25/M40 family metallo-hydrolase [Anaerolineales bacterium]